MDKDFMLRAIFLATKGYGKVSPNPLVGAVIVKNGKVIGEGYHRFYGDTHGEVNALNSCCSSTVGATLYCNLEPCSTYYPGKKNSPCCNAIINAKIKRVVIAQIDPNPHVSGKGVKRLRSNGIEVVTGVELESAVELNRGFNRVMISGRPYIHIKWAQSLDGQIATSNGNSRWISSDACRRQTHSYRSKCDGIIVGRRTVELDNPQLNARYGFSPSPRPIVIDANLKNKPNSLIFKRYPIIFCNKDIIKERQELFNGDKVLLPGIKFSIEQILKKITQFHINTLFVEGGADLISQFLVAGLWDRITIYTAPKILGAGISPVGNLNISHPKNAITFEDSHIEIIDNHMVFNGYKEKGFRCLQD